MTPDQGEGDRRVWEVYIVETESGKLYTGITNDLDRRFAEHQMSRRGAKFFRISKPKRLAYREPQSSRAAASSRERQIKLMSRREKLEMIAAHDGARRFAADG